MNIKKIIKEVIDELSWMDDIVPDPLTVGNMIIITGVGGKGNHNHLGEQYGIIKITELDSDFIYYDMIAYKGSGWNSGKTPIEGARKLIKEHYWRLLSSTTPKELLIDDQDPEVFLPYITPTFDDINESDDLDWIRDVRNPLNMSNTWILINDIDTHSIEESHKIQKYLFDLGYKWIYGNNLKDYKMSAVTHEHPDEGHITYFSDGHYDMKSINDQIESGEYYSIVTYWSHLRPNGINESDDLDWIRDTKTTPTEPFVGMRFTHGGSPDEVFTITSIDDDKILITTIDDPHTTYRYDHSVWDSAIERGRIKSI